MAVRLVTPRELFGARLRRLLWIELRLANEVLPTLIEAVRAPDLRHGLERHLLETEDHVLTVRDVLDELGLPTDPEESPAFAGLEREHEDLVERVAGNHLLEDLVHAQAAVATEHLELAGYEPLASLADALGREEIGMRLREVQEQEEFALELLERAQAKLLAEHVESALL